MSASDDPAAANGRTRYSFSASIAARSPNKARSGNNSAACTGRGAPPHPPPAAQPEWERPQMWTADGLHPSSLGHHLFAAGVAEQ